MLKLIPLMIFCLGLSLSFSQTTFANESALSEKTQDWGDIWDEIFDDDDDDYFDDEDDDEDESLWDRIWSRDEDRYDRDPRFRRGRYPYRRTGEWGFISCRRRERHCARDAYNNGFAEWDAIGNAPECRGWRERRFACYAR